MAQSSDDSPEDGQGREESEQEEVPSPSSPSVEQNDFDAIDKAIEASFKLQRRRQEWERENLPPNPPNEKCSHAVIDGALIERQVIHGSLNVTVDEGFFPLLEFGPETVFIWTRPDPDSDRPPRPLLVTHVASNEPHEVEVWKTLGSCWELSVALISSFESMPEVSYQWVYYFDPQEPWEEQLWHGYSPWTSSSPFSPSGFIHTIRDWAAACPVLELLLRDDAFFLSARHLYNAAKNHWFCLICALQKEGYKKHKNHHPEIWQRAQEYPAMEIAVVQATRATEAILGEPGNPDNKSSVYKMRERWKSNLNLDPDEEFHLAGTTFLKYYMRQLYPVRNRSAHGFGEISSFEVSRERAIAAQSFAYLVARSYWEKKGLSQFEAMNRLRFNRRPLRQAIFADAQWRAQH